MKNTWLRSLSNLLLPNSCLFCSEPIWGQKPFLCSNCIATIEPVPQIYNEIYLEKIDPCYIDKVLIAFVYGPIIQELIEKLKYHGQKEIGILLGEIAGTVLQDSLPEDFRITSIPLHRRREKSRGYNQADLIGLGLQKGRNVLFSSILKRTRVTPTQTKLTKEERRENVANAFTLISPDYPGNDPKTPVLIVDDVLTSGATMNEAARVLKISGYRQVIAFGISTPIINDFY